MRLRSSDGDADRLREELERLRAEKQTAVDAEAYEEAGEIKQRIDGLQARLSERPDSDGLSSRAVQPVAGAYV